jgi:hypothetical protein
VDEHLKAVIGCDLSTAEDSEGITQNLERRLKSRKKTRPDQTPHEMWEEIYSMIFPNDEVPTPCKFF